MLGLMDVLMVVLLDIDSMRQRDIMYSAIGFGAAF